MEISNTAHIYIKSDDQNIKLRFINEKDNKEIDNPDESVQTSFWGKSNGKVDKESVQNSIDEILKKLDLAGYTKARDIIIPDSFDNSENYVAEKDNDVQYIDIYVKDKEKPSNKPEEPNKDTDKSLDKKAKVEETPNTGDRNIYTYWGLGLVSAGILASFIFKRLKKRNS